VVSSLEGGRAELPGDGLGYRKGIQTSNKDEKYATDTQLITVSRSGGHPRLEDLRECEQAGRHRQEEGYANALNGEEGKAIPTRKAWR